MVCFVLVDELSVFFFRICVLKSQSIFYPSPQSFYFFSVRHVAQFWVLLWVFIIEMSGPYIGYRPTAPRLPDDGGVAAGNTLWKVSEELTGVVAP